MKTKYIMSSNFNVETYVPKDEECFGFWVEVLIGPDDQDGGNLYQFFFCSPKWLEQNIANNETIPGRAMIIAKQFNLRLFTDAINKIILECGGEDAQETFLRLSTFGLWEYADYTSGS